jgi:hypothetical protein
MLVVLAVTFAAIGIQTKMIRRKNDAPCVDVLDSP